MEKNPVYKDVQGLSIALTKAASITDSAGEKSFPAYLKSVLSKIPYFKTNPDKISLYPIPGDPKQRSNLFALVQGNTSACVILTGHYDVVHTSMYGSLEPWAFDPETLQKKILEMTAGVTGKDNPLFRLKEDLESGDFLPGRGMLDMKSGLAAGISLLSSFSHPREREGNILFCAVADEEGSSHGMKAAAGMLQQYLAEKNLIPVAVFNLDAAVDQESGELGRAVFTGSVGKTLPFVFFIGKCTHAGAPFDGINPVLIASEFATDVESNPDAFQERQTVSGEEAPPPSILYFRESRTSYDVTTPPSVFCAVNVLSHSRNPEDIIETTGKIAKAAMDRSISLLRERASTLSRRVSGHFSLPLKSPVILGFDEYANLAERTSPGILDSARSFAAKQFPHDKVQQTLSVLQSLLPFSGTEGPAAVVGFAPPYYARAEFDRGKYPRFLEILRSEISSFSREIGKSMKLRPFFPGISDISFLAPSDSLDQRSFVRSHTPIVDVSSSEETRISIGCPVVNLGPWGREYHQMGERVHRRYSFEEMPILLGRLVRAALDMEHAMPKRAPMTLVFDCGQVITCAWNMEAVDRMAELLETNRDEFVPIYIGERGDYDRGTLSALEYWTNVASRFGILITPELLERLKELDMDSWFTINPETIAIIADLKAQGHSICMLSNMNVEGKMRMYGKARWLEGKDWLSLFDQVFLSCDLKMVKPEREIFETCLRMIGKTPSLCLFIDDMENNVQAARDCGMKAIHFSKADRLRSQLKAEYDLL